MTDRMSTDLLSDPALPEVGDMPELLSGTPYDKAYNLLSSTEGKNLEIMTRTNPRLVQAATASYTLVAAFGTQFVRGKTDQFLRFAVSMGGQGRQDQECAGGRWEQKAGREAVGPQPACLSDAFPQHPREPPSEPTLLRPDSWFG